MTPDSPDPRSAVTGAALAIVNPIAQPESHTKGSQRFEPAKRPDTLDGKTVGLYWNGKQNGLFALDRTREHLSRMFKDVSFIDIVGEKGGTNRYLSEEQLEKLVREADVVVATTAD